jgi:hypothetical protein
MMTPHPETMKATLSRIATLREVIYPTLEDAKRAGFKSIGCGLLLRAAASGNTEVWAIEPREDGQLQLLIRSDVGYDPELRSATIERKIIAAEKDAVDTPYGRGKLLGKTKDGDPIVMISSKGKEQRYVFPKDKVTAVGDQAITSVRLQAKDPSDTSVKDYVEQMLFSMYGDKEYAKKLAETFGETQP